MEIKKKQQKIQMVLEGMKIEYSIFDISSSDEHKKEMREGCNNEQALPPQIFNENIYCGGYDEFEEAIENEELKTFLKL